MNPFLEIPVILEKQTAVKSGAFGKKLIVREAVEATGRILPGEIAAHYPTAEGGAVLVLKSGVTIVTSLSCDDIDTARQRWESYLKANPKQTANVVLVKSQSVAAPSTADNKPNF